MVMTVNSPETFGSPTALDPPLLAATLLADPVSTLLDRSRLAIAGAIALRPPRHLSRLELILLLLRDLLRELIELRALLKRVITEAFAAGDVDAASTHQFVDRFELWSA